MFMPLGCPHLSAQLQPFPGQKQPPFQAGHCGKAAQESQGIPSRAAAPREAAQGGDAWKAPFTFCVSAPSQRAKPPRSRSQRSGS